MSADTVVDLRGIFYVLGGALLIHVLAGIVSGTKAVTRTFRARQRTSVPWRYGALQSIAEPVWSALLFASVAVQIATMVALALIALATLVVLPFDRPLSATLFQAFLLVLIASAFGSIVLSAAARIEILIRRLLRGEANRART